MSITSRKYLNAVMYEQGSRYKTDREYEWDGVCLRKRWGYDKLVAETYILVSLDKEQTRERKIVKRMEYGE